MEELREKLVEVITRVTNATIIPETPHEVADQILAFIKQAGYVKLSDDQSLPNKPYRWNRCDKYKNDYWYSSEEIWELGFRRVEL